MLSYNQNLISSSLTLEEFENMFSSIFLQEPQISNSVKKNPLQKISNTTGRTVGHLKNFFSKTEIKAATLVSYWAADAFVALILILTSPSMIAVILSLFLFTLHTYATFSVVAEII